MLENGGPALAVNNITPNMTSQFNLATKSKEGDEYQDALIILLNRNQIWRIYQSDQDQSKNKLARIYDLNIQGLTVQGLT